MLIAKAHVNYSGRVDKGNLTPNLPLLSYKNSKILGFYH